MVRPSQIARKAQRTHQRQQENLRKQNLPTCQDCDVCSAIKDREVWKTLRDFDKPFSQAQEYKQSPRSKIRQGLKTMFFKGAVFIRPRHIALAEAADRVGASIDNTQLVYWTDCSLLKNSCGIGIAYCSFTGVWTELSWGVVGHEKTHVLEIYAIAKALEIAWEAHCKLEVNRRPSSVCIYSDSAGALGYFLRFRQSLLELKGLPYGERLVGPGIFAAGELNALNVSIELRYVPGHAGILGNCMADRAARRGANYPVGKPRAGKLMTKCGRLENCDV